MTDKYPFFHTTWWTSALGDKHISQVRRFLDNNDLKIENITLRTLKRGTPVKDALVSTYSRGGGSYGKLERLSLPSDANCLVLTLGIETRDDHESGLASALQIINALRTIFGMCAARELLFFGIKSADDTKTRLQAPPYPASPFEHDWIMSPQSPPLGQARITAPTYEVATLLDQASQSHDPLQAFVFLWLAFEALIRLKFEDSEKHNGQLRKRYFEEILKSSLASNEVHKLFKLRCDIFKEGKYSESPKELWGRVQSLRYAVRLALLEECGERTRFLTFYEDYLQLEPEIRSEFYWFFQKFWDEQSE